MDAPAPRSPAVLCGIQRFHLEPTGIRVSALRSSLDHAADREFAGWPRSTELSKTSPLIDDRWVHTHAILTGRLGRCPAPARRTAGRTRSVTSRCRRGISGLQRPSPAGARGAPRPHARGFHAAHGAPRLPEPPGHSPFQRVTQTRQQSFRLQTFQPDLQAAGRPVNQSCTASALQRCQKKGLSAGFSLSVKSKAQHNSASMSGKILCE